MSIRFGNGRKWKEIEQAGKLVKSSKEIQTVFNGKSFQRHLDLDTILVVIIYIQLRIANALSTHIKTDKHNFHYFVPTLR